MAAHVSEYKCAKIFCVIEHLETANGRKLPCFWIEGAEVDSMNQPTGRHESTRCAMRVSITGYLIGAMLGIGLSLPACRWIERATYNTRAFLPAVEAIGAGTTDTAVALLKEFEKKVVFDRLFEVPDLMEGVRALIRTVPARVSAKNPEGVTPPESP